MPHSVLLLVTNFWNPEMPGLERHESRDSGLTKTARISGILDTGIPIASQNLLWYIS